MANPSRREALQANSIAQEINNRVALWVERGDLAIVGLTRPVSAQTLLSLLPNAELPPHDHQLPILSRDAPAQGVVLNPDGTVLLPLHLQPPYCRVGFDFYPRVSTPGNHKLRELCYFLTVALPMPTALAQERASERALLGQVDPETLSGFFTSTFYFILGPAVVYTDTTLIGTSPFVVETLQADSIMGRPATFTELATCDKLLPRPSDWLPPQELNF